MGKQGFKKAIYLSFIAGVFVATTSISVFAWGKCLLEGNVNLQITPPTGEATSISGYIGFDRIGWRVNGTGVLANIEGRSFYLTFTDTGYQSELSGWINNSYIDWAGTGGTLTGYQTCIDP